MKYWVNTISLDHVERGVAGGFTQSSHGKPQGLLKLQRYDYMVFYSPKTAYVDGLPLQAFTALGRLIDDETYQVDVSDDFHPYRRNIEFIPSHQVAIKPLLNDLSFIADKTHWGYKFRFGLFEIPEADFAVIALAMGVSIPLQK